MHIHASRRWPIRPGRLAISPSLPENETLLNTVKPAMSRPTSMIVANSYFRGKLGFLAPTGDPPAGGLGRDIGGRT
jgi:hypothetical protein